MSESRHKMLFSLHFPRHLSAASVFGFPGAFRTWGFGWKRANWQSGWG